MSAGRKCANPFCTGHERGKRCSEWVDATSRILAVKLMDIPKLRAVLAMPDIQSTVRVAAYRQLRKLGAA